MDGEEPEAEQEGKEEAIQDEGDLVAAEQSRQMFCLHSTEV